MLDETCYIEAVKQSVLARKPGPQIALMEVLPVNLLSTEIGEELAPLVKPPITQEQLQRYAQASGDFNPIHLDEDAAHRVGLDSVIAHGMLSMAFLGQFVQQQIAEVPDAFLVQLKVRFLNMVRLGDTLTCLGTIKAQSSAESGRKEVEIECWAQNQKGERVTTGEAIIAIPQTAEEVAA